VPAPTPCIVRAPLAARSPARIPPAVSVLPPSLPARRDAEEQVVGAAPPLLAVGTDPLLKDGVAPLGSGGVDGVERYDTGVHERQQ
jgi:hypothetical protein